MNILQDVLVLLLVYFPPLGFFVWALRKRKFNIFLLAIIGIVYIGLTLFTGTQNLIPSIFVLIDISLMRTSKENGRIISNDSYLEYGFSIKEFSIVSALKYSGISYAITFGLSVILSIILYVFKINLAQQKIVTELINIPLNKFMFMAPMMIIFAPILEEFIFRWFLFEEVISRRIGLVGGAIISSMIFALAHFNIRSFTIIFTLGLMNCYLIQKKGFWYAVFNHSVFNSVTVIAMLLQKIMG
jgi:membrane protease YdiL (CAAX protease family)